MPVVPLGYPLDLTGVAPSNLISNEIRTFTIAADRVFVPAGGPFFTTGMHIRHGVTNALLQPNTQYKLLHLHKTASLMARKEICAVILILDNAVPSVKLTYQIIGSYFADTADTIRDLVAANPITNPTTIPWGSIFGAPSQFPPVEHLHHVDELYGMSDVVAVLEQLRQAILLGDSFAISALYQYINNLLTNLDYATYSQVLALFNSIERPPIKVYNTYADLRAETDVINDAALVYLTLGKDTPIDGKGRAFYWDVDSAIIDDGDITVKPTIITGLNTGRFISILAVEKNLRDSLKTLGRGINPDGTVLTDLELVNPVIGDAVDFNDVIVSGVYLFDGSGPNVGSPGFHVNWPTNALVGKLEVESSATIFTQTATTILNRNTFTDTATPNNADYAINVRTGIIIGNNPIAWSGWTTSYSQQRAKIHGLDSVLSVDNLYVADMDALIYPGKYWVDTNAANRPFDNAEVEVSIIEGTRNSPTRVLQKVINGTELAVREGVLIATVWTFSPWTYIGAATAAELDVNLGLVVRYFGQTPVLMPCYIGEDPTPYSVTVKISGEVKTISLDDIAPVPDLILGSDNLAYIYLVENPPGTYALSRLVSPVFPSDGNMTAKRKALYHPSDDPNTSNRLFVGLGYSDGTIWRLCRSWFQDPGFIENYYDYMDPTLLSNPSALSVGVSGNTKPASLPEALIGYLGIFYTPGTFHLESNVGAGALQGIPFISWAGEAVHVSFRFNAKIVNPESSYATYLRAFLEKIVSNGGLGYIGGFGNHRVQNGGYAAPGDDTNTYDTISSTFTAVNKDDAVGIFKLGAVGAGGATLRLLPDFGYNATITLTQIHNFRKLYINASNPAIWFPNLRVIYLTGTVLDLDLKAYHDTIYGGPAPADTTVEFVVQSGCLVCSSSTSTYALTNPDTWASGVVTKLTVQGGGYVSGRGGDGGRGGRAYRLATDPANFFNYIGGFASSPSSHVHGKKGGSAIRTMRALIIENAGYIGVGGGGGGASGGGIIFFNTAGVVSKIALGGNSGGGGWPFGSAGAQSQIREDDSSFAEYYLDTLDGYQAWHVAGNIGENSGGLAYGPTTVSLGGVPITRTNGSAVISHAAGGDGSLPFISQASTGGGGTSWNNVVSAQIGDAGNGGDDGDYAINSTGGSFTIVPAGGSIVGSTI